MAERSLRTKLRRKRALAIQDGRAVSPVVATLILILVAVAAAAALYLWLVAWQGGITGSIGSQQVQYTVTIGGSTSVYPFDQVAVAQFEQNNSNIVVSNNQGGTGAGMLAVCHGSVDIGASSSLQTLTGLETNDGCPSTTIINTVAYDAVDPITAVANTHGLVSISSDTLLSVYVKSSTTAYLGTTALAVDGTTLTTAPLSGLVIGATGFQWEQIPACVLNTANCGGTGNPTEVLATSIGAGVACPAGVDICATGAGASPCGFTVCAGPFLGTTGTNVIQTVERSDTSGTEQTFTAKLLGISGTNQVTTLSSLQNNFGGCGSDGQLASCGITATSGQNGNPAVISYVAGHPDALGFASDGLARATSSGVTCQGTATGACGIGFEGVGQTSSVQPSLGASGTIAAAITNSGTVAQYQGWRPFEWVTTSTPTGEAARLLQFVMDPANNINFAAESAEISIYSV